MEPLIIEGTPRSGTRFFCDFIEKQFNIKIFRLQRILPKYDKKVYLYGNLENYSNLKKLLNDLNGEIIVKERIGEIDVDKLANSSQNRSFSSIIDHILAKKAQEDGFSSWGLKFDNPIGMEICNRLFPKSKFIHIIRDGRDVHLSAIKCLSEGFYTPYKNAKFWSSQIEHRRKIGWALGCERYGEIKYETLLSNPNLIFETIAKFLCLEVSNYKNMYIKKSNFYKWKNNMSQRQIRVYEAVAGNLLNSLEYETMNFNAAKCMTEIIYYQLMEFPLKLKVYLFEIINPKGKQRVFRRLKLKLNEYKNFYRNYL